ncbi:MAG: DNA-3-methyladenine glycosylase [Streptosporangiales bacterium]|nr:DNA-3-methyladenine glycosylase [Streptosporangiales bacterium]
MSDTDRQLLPREFFDRPALAVAPDLLGHVVEHRAPGGLVALRVTEVEAYEGADDPASHAYRGRSARNATMFGDPGHVYVYFTYGMHFCMNVVCQPAGTASAVLLRAGEVIEGAELARVRRGTSTGDRELARGPARLTVALGVAREEDGADGCSAASALRLCRGSAPPGSAVATSARTGVANGAQQPWRFYVAGDPTVSPYRKHVPKRRTPSNPSA